MRHVWLHIGLGKTGSSALQAWLSLNSAELARQGISHADLVPEAKSGEVTSGNGFPLWQAFRNKDYDAVEELLSSVYFGDSASSAVISCELLQNMSRKHIRMLRDIANRRDITVHIVAFVRSVYEHCYSSYAQKVKRGGAEHVFGSSPEDLYSARFADSLINFSLYFPDNVTVLNYDETGRDIFSAFAAATGIDQGATRALQETVNRSLSPGEVEVMRKMNRLHGGVFSTAISNHLLALHPGKRGDVHYDEELLARVREHSGAEVAWVNRQFDVDPPLQTDRRALAPAPAGDAPQDEESALSATLDWALAAEPTAENAIHLVEFLEALSGYLGEAGYDNAGNPAGRAAQLRDGASYKTALRDADEAAAQGPPRRFLITYFDPPHELTAEQERELGVALVAWLARLGKVSEGPALNPLKKGLALGPGADGDNGGPHALNGFTIVESRSVDELQSLARACPLLEVGGAVQVSEIGEMGYYTKSAG